MYKYLIIEFTSEHNAQVVHNCEYQPELGKRRIGRFTLSDGHKVIVCRPEQYRTLAADYDFVITTDGFAIGFDGKLYDTITGICME